VAAVAGSIAVAAALTKRRAPAPAPAADHPPPPLPRRRPDTAEIPAVPGSATLDVAPGAIAEAPAANGHVPHPVAEGDPDARFEAAAHLLADLATPPDGPRRATAAAETPAPAPAAAPTPAPTETPAPRPSVGLRSRPEGRSEAGSLTLPPVPPDPHTRDRFGYPVENGNGRALRPGAETNGAAASPAPPAPPPPAPPAPPVPPSPEAEPYRALPPLPAPPDETRPRWPLVAGAAVVLVLVIGLMVVVLGGGGSDDAATDASGGRGADTSAETLPTTTTVVDLRSLAPIDAVTLAGARLREAGTFTYQGTSLATDVSPVRPGVWLTVELTHTGEVDLGAGELHDVGVTADGRATETVADGTIVWGRLADSVDELAGVAYLTIGEPNELPEPTGALLLPTWLELASTVEDLPDDGSGRRHLRLVVPADAFGEVETGAPPADAEIILSLDGTGTPVRVEVRTIDGPPLTLAWDLVVGAPTGIVLPDPDTGDPTGDDGTAGTPDSSDLSG
jgi:hypothetical protein